MQTDAFGKTFTAGNDMNRHLWICSFKGIKILADLLNLLYRAEKELL